MSKNINEILAGAPKATGAIFKSEIVLPTAKVPADPNAALDPLLLDLGFADESGIVRSVGRETTKIKAWGGDTVRVVQTDHNVSIQFAMLQFRNLNVLKAVRGNGNVSQDATTKVITGLIKSDPLEKCSIVIDMLDGANKIRLVAPVAQVTETTDEEFKHDDIVKIGVTIECFPNDSGVKMYDYMLPAA